jgi:hypothetical protein
MACLAIGGGAVGLAPATTGSEVTGCTTHQCDQCCYDWPPAVAGSPGGVMQTQDLYVTNDINKSPWLTYNGNTTIRLWFPPEVAGRSVQLPVVAVGTDDMPNADTAMAAGVNYTTGVGQLAILNALTIFPEPKNVHLVTSCSTACSSPDGSEGRMYPVGGSVTITNTTCATFFTHVEVTFGPLADAGIDGSD